MSFNTNIPSKISVENKVLIQINEWLGKVNFPGKVIFRSWMDERSANASIRYPKQPLLVNCDLAVFLNINEQIYRIFIIFKINNFKYELNAMKKALLCERSNGIISYDSDAKKAFKITRNDKNAIVIFVAHSVSDEQTNSWKSRVLCCHSDNIIAIIKQQLTDIKETIKNNKKATIKSLIGK